MKKGKKGNKRKTILNILIVLFALVFVVCGIKLAIEYYHLNKEDNSFKQLQEEVDPFEKNSDMVAWLSVKGTYIDYPVMLTPDDPEFYLHADFDKNYSYSGTPFMDYRCTLDSDNMVIYGHNMLNGTMFSTLSNFEEKSFFDEHHIIRLETRKGVRKYTVLAAFKTDVEAAEPIYDFVQAYDAGEYNQFVQMVKEASLYDTGEDAAYGDQLITLSTCAYHVENGRFIVVGKRIK